MTTDTEITWLIQYRPAFDTTAFNALAYAAEQPGALSVQDIAEQLGCPASTVSAAVGHLRRAGLLKRGRTGPFRVRCDPKTGKRLQGHPAVLLRATRAGAEYYRATMKAKGAW